MQFQFETTLERDIDLLIIEEFVSSLEFAQIFLDAVGITDSYTIQTVIHSKTDAEFGESDIVFILSIGNKTHALHIEDKIDAIAMHNQYHRYHKRAQKDIANGEYDDYSVVIVAPSKYLAANKEAQKYKHHVQYETLRSYFQRQNDNRSLYKLALINRALLDQQHSYQWKADANVVRFCAAMTLYQKENYPSLPLGSTAWWPYYSTLLKNAKLVLKANKGFCDLQFNNSSAEDIYMLTKAHLTERMNVVTAGKSASIRIVVKPIDFKKEFSDCLAEVEGAFIALQELHELSKSLIESNPTKPPADYHP